MVVLAIDFQTGQARWADTGLVRKNTALARCGTAWPMPVPGPACHRARAWAYTPARSAGTGTARSNGQHGGGTGACQPLIPSPRS